MIKIYYYSLTVIGFAPAAQSHAGACESAFLLRVRRFWQIDNFDEFCEMVAELLNRSAKDKPPKP